MNSLFPQLRKFLLRVIVAHVPGNKHALFILLLAAFVGVQGKH
jgi:hypothetical protein